MGWMVIRVATAAVLLSSRSCNLSDAFEDEFFKPKSSTSGPWVQQSSGAIWPKPAYQFASSNVLEVDPRKFEFELNDAALACSSVVQSLPRFRARMFPGESRDSRQTHHRLQPPNISILNLSKMRLELEESGACQDLPHLRMDENYTVAIDAKKDSERYIRAATNWGLLRGLESFSQLVFMSQEGGTFSYRVNETLVSDYPRFPHRGFMIDTARHFLSKTVILQTLDLMEMNKMNVLHWHVTDHESFPFESSTFPDLSKKGSYDPVTHVYRKKDVLEIVEAARIRGIRVIPEFDTPGHTKSWEKGQPGLLTQCYVNGRPVNRFGPMNPTKESVYVFLEQLYSEIASVFPDQYLHIGGDEVDTNCWWEYDDVHNMIKAKCTVEIMHNWYIRKNNPRIREVMDLWNITGRYRLLESFFVERVLSIVKDLPGGKSSIVWQEVFDNGDQINPDTIVQVWKEWQDWKNELKTITSFGQPVILSAPWYLNYFSYGSDWLDMYTVDPAAFPGAEASKDLLLGGEACIWGEYVNSVNLIPRSWPRASAVAERLWSSASVRSLTDAGERLQEHECRMLTRGFPVQPTVGAGYCPVVWTRKK